MGQQRRSTAAAHERCTRWLQPQRLTHSGTSKPLSAGVRYKCPSLCLARSPCSRPGTTGRTGSAVNQRWCWRKVSVAVGAGSWLAAMRRHAAGGAGFYHRRLAKTARVAPTSMAALARSAVVREGTGPGMLHSRTLVPPVQRATYASQPGSCSEGRDRQATVGVKGSYSAHHSVKWGHRLLLASRIGAADRRSCHASG